MQLMVVIDAVVILASLAVIEVIAIGAVVFFIDVMDSTTMTIMYAIMLNRCNSYNCNDGCYGHKKFNSHTGSHRAFYYFIFCTD